MADKDPVELVEQMMDGRRREEIVDKPFPAMVNERILQVARGEVPDKIPVWVMRQAGRYLPEFRSFRVVNSFFHICDTPELAAFVTLMPIKRFALDGAIIFSDILVVPRAMGLPVEMIPGEGPVIKNPLITPDSLDSLSPVGDAVDAVLAPVCQALTLTRHLLKGQVPLIGFCGAPWTLMCYMIEGKGSKTQSKAKKWLYQHREGSVHLINMLKDVCARFLIQQIDSGAQMVQIFESNAEYLTQSHFREFSLNPVIEMCRQVKATHPDVPISLFFKGAHYAVPLMAEVASESPIKLFDVAQLDWTIDMEKARKESKGLFALQGNIDPCALYGSRDSLKEAVTRVATGAGTKGIIFNLGHGIYPDMEPESVANLVDLVHDITIQ